MQLENVFLLRCQFAPEDMAPFLSDKRVKSCAQCAGMVGEMDKQGERERAIDRERARGHA